MAVYTEVNVALAQPLFRQLNIGQLLSLKACSGGIENTNYFATTSAGEYVLTLFERLTFEQLPYYLQLMHHLAANGIPVPKPEANRAGAILHQLQGKPAAVVNRLDGQSQLSPSVAHCRETGKTLATMHLAGLNFEMAQPNLRGLAWWNETAPVILPFLSDSQRHLLTHELKRQNQLAGLPNYQELPRGPIHGDLFRDNVMFDGERLTGFFDFYFAGNDTWLFDLAVALNDWTVDLATGASDPYRAQAMVQAYQEIRPLTETERKLLADLLRAAALRFWISRLWDLHLPRQASVLKAHDPHHFQRILVARIEHPFAL
jgi:homoserine kinase type II